MPSKRLDAFAEMRQRNELYNCLINSLPDGAKSYFLANVEIRKMIRKLNPSTVPRVTAMVTAHRAIHYEIAENVLSIMDHPETADETLINAEEHFDYAVELGWLCSAHVFTLMHDALGYVKSDEPLSSQQKRALIRLEDSRWDKNMSAESGTRTNSKDAYSPTTQWAAMKYPQDIETIIKLAVEIKPETEAQWEALIKGELITPLSEGAL